MAGEACLGHRGIPARGSFGLQSNPRSPQVRAIKKQAKKHKLAFCFFRGGEEDLCEFFYCFSASGYLKKNFLSTFFFLCVRVCVYIYLIAHITAQSGPVTLLIVILCY